MRCVRRTETDADIADLASQTVADSHASVAFLCDSDTLDGVGNLSADGNNCETEESHRRLQESNPPCDHLCRDKNITRQRSTKKVVESGLSESYSTSCTGGT